MMKCVIWHHLAEITRLQTQLEVRISKAMAHLQFNVEVN